MPRSPCSSTPVGRHAQHHHINQAAPIPSYYQSYTPRYDTRTYASAASPVTASNYASASRAVGGGGAGGGYVRSRLPDVSPTFNDVVVVSDAAGGTGGERADLTPRGLESRVAGGSAERRGGGDHGNGRFIEFQQPQPQQNYRDTSQYARFPSSAATTGAYEYVYTWLHVSPNACACDPAALALLLR